MLKEHCGFLVVSLIGVSKREFLGNWRRGMRRQSLVEDSQEKGTNAEVHSIFLCITSKSLACSSPSITLWGQLLFARFFLQWMSYMQSTLVLFAWILFQRIWLVGESHTTIIPLKYEHACCFLSLMDGRTQVWGRHILQGHFPMPFLILLTE